MTGLKQMVGQQGEDLAGEYLQQNRYQIIARNFRCRYGEVDIIAQKDNVIHFVEVKNRQTDYLPGRYAVNRGKQRHIRQVAKLFLSTKKIATDCFVSFDVIEITEGKLEFLENCFY